MVYSLAPKLTQAQAVSRFHGQGLSGLFKTLVRGPLRSIADVYLPFRLFRVEIHNALRQQNRWLALDAVRGTFDLYSFEQEPSPEQLQRIETRNHPPAELSFCRAEEILLDRVRGMIFRKGFFSLRDLRICAEPVPLELHIPYWVGFLGRRQVAGLSVIDAVRGCFEGAKMRHFLREWLLR